MRPKNSQVFEQDSLLFGHSDRPGNTLSGPKLGNESSHFRIGTRAGIQLHGLPM